MLSELQQKRVWEGRLSSEIRANYFADLSGGYHRKQHRVTWAMIVLSSSAAGAFVASFPSKYAWVAPTLSLLTAALSGYSLAVQNHKSAIDSADLYVRWSKLASEYELLWDNMYAEQAKDKLAELTESAIELSKIATAFPVIEKRLLKWQDYVEQQHAAGVHALGA